MSRNNGLARQRCCKSAPSLVVCNVVRKHGDGTIHWTELSLIFQWKYGPITGSLFTVLSADGGLECLAAKGSDKKRQLKYHRNHQKLERASTCPKMLSETTRKEGVILL